MQIIKGMHINNKHINQTIKHDNQTLKKSLIHKGSPMESSFYRTCVALQWTFSWYNLSVYGVYGMDRTMNSCFLSVERGNKSHHLVFGHY
jgi:hypothetical protein